MWPSGQRERDSLLASSGAGPPPLLDQTHPSQCSFPCRLLTSSRPRRAVSGAVGFVSARPALPSLVPSDHRRVCSRPMTKAILLKLRRDHERQRVPFTLVFCRGLLGWIAEGRMWLASAIRQLRFARNPETLSCASKGGTRHRLAPSLQSPDMSRRGKTGGPLADEVERPLAHGPGERLDLPDLGLLPRRRRRRGRRLGRAPLLPDEVDLGGARSLPLGVGGCRGCLAAHAHVLRRVRAPSARARAESARELLVRTSWQSG